MHSFSNRLAIIANRASTKRQTNFCSLPMRVPPCVCESAHRLKGPFPEHTTALLILNPLKVLDTHCTAALVHNCGDASVAITNICNTYEHCKILFGKV